MVFGNPFLFLFPIIITIVLIIIITIIIVNLQLQEKKFDNRFEKKCLVNRLVNRKSAKQMTN